MKIVALALSIIAGAGLLAHGADNFYRGWDQFDGATGLRQGFELEDLVTQAYPTWESAQTNNPLRMVDGTVIGMVYRAIGSTWWTYTVLTNSITSGHIKDGTITTNDLADEVIDRLVRKTSAMCWTEAQSPTSGTLTVSSTLGWATATNSLTVENYDVRSNMVNAVFHAPYAGMYQCSIMFYAYLPLNFATNLTTILVGMVRDQSPYGNVSYSSPSAEDTYYSGVGHMIGGGIATNGLTGGTFGSYCITFNKTIALGEGVRVIPSFYLYSNYGADIDFAYVTSPDPDDPTIQSWLQWNVNEVSKGSL